MSAEDRSEPVPEAAGRRVALVTLAGGNVVQVGTRLILGTTVPFVLVHFETTKSQVGLALTGMWALYAFFQFPSGVLSDRYGERPLVLIGLAGAIVGAMLVALSPTLFLYGVFALVLGAGTGLYFPPSTALVSRLFQDRGQAIGALTAGSAVAGVVFPALGGTVGSRFGWRAATALGAVVSVPTLLGARMLLPALPAANPERDVRAAVDVTKLGELLSRPNIAFVTMLAVATAFTFQAITSFLPTFLVEYRGLNAGQAGIVFGVVFGLSAVAQMLFGRISDSISRDLAIAASITLCATGIAVLLAIPDVVGLFVGATLLGGGISWPGPMQAHVMDHLGDDERGFGYGLVRTVYMLLASSGSVIVGTLTDASGWVVGYGSVVGLLCVCLLLLGANRVLRFGIT